MYYDLNNSNILNLSDIRKLISTKSLPSEITDEQLLELGFAKIVYVLATPNPYQNIINSSVEIINGIPTITQTLQDKPQAEIDIIIKDELKSNGSSYILDGISYTIPLDKDAQDTITTLAVMMMMNGILDQTTIYFSNGTIFPITAPDFLPFAQWFATNRNALFV